ncbi:MAG: serpin family protein [Chitinophagales bacterium]
MKVNEEGTEAAAVTSIDIVVTSLPAGVYINRPFILLIREETTGAILFIGRINNPTE